MKIIYCIHSVYNPGGMERVLLNKVTYLSKHTDWDISVVTTDQHHRPTFYPFPAKIRMFDLDINYSDDNDKGVFTKIVGYLKRREKHKKALKRLLLKEKADIVVSLYPSESSFLCDIHDGSKKILELHFNKFFRLQYNRSGLLGLIDRFRTWQDESIVRKFDRFVVLTDEDKKYWGNLPNIVTIPNAALFMSAKYSDLKSKRVIAVGRLDYQKGFDRLLEAWRIVSKNIALNGWRLDIFGQGEWKSMLESRILEYGLQSSVKINEPSKEIGKEYLKSSLIVMSSNYEGFGMVLVEGMACGLPAVAFDCKCGPRDIIKHGENGFLVKNGDIEGLANALMKLMNNENLRRDFSEEAKKVVEVYSEEHIMKMWLDLFESFNRAGENFN